MAINFPTSPATGDTYSFGGKKWVFNGTGWAIDASAGGTTSQYWRGDKSWRDFATDARSATAYTQTGTGAVSRDTADKALEIPSPQDYGAVADGVTDDTTAVSNAIAAKPDLRLTGDYLVTSVSNDYGVPMEGPGRILKAITGGDQQLNSRAFDGQHIFGQEYLSAFHKKLLGVTQTTTIVCSGDSTTESGAATSPYLIHQILAILGTERGHKLSTVNAGHSGKDTNDWVTLYLSGDLALNPDLYVVRWGINDPFNGRTLAQFVSSLRSGLSTIRASKTLAQMSILLMAPSTTSDTPNGRDERWYEQVRLAVRQAAHDYQCCFMDTYAIWQNARGAAGVYMDDPYGDGRAIHPQNVFNALIGSKMSEVLFPKALRYQMQGSAYGTLNATASPSAFPYNQWLVAGSSSGWPINNAQIFNIKTADDGVIQRVFSRYGSGANNGNYPRPEIAERMGDAAAGTWYDWSTLPSVDLTSYLQNGWTNFSASFVCRAKKTNNQVTLQGIIKGGTVTAGTVILNLPAGFRPRNAAEYFHVPTDAVAPPTAFVPGLIQITSAGDVKVLGAVQAGYVALSGISFEVGA